MDPAFSSMGPAERGVYVSVVLYILAHRGSVPFDPIALTAVCNCTNREEFLSLWQTVKENFVIKNYRLRNAWVTRAISHARKAQWAKRLSSPEATAKHRPSDSSSNAQVQLNEVQGKEDAKNQTEMHSEQSTPGGKGCIRLAPGTLEDRVLVMAGHIRRHIRVRTLGDRIRFADVAQWVVECIDSGQATEALASKVEQAARKAAGAENPAACFIATVRDELGYQPPDTKPQKSR